MKIKQIFPYFKLVCASGYDSFTTQYGRIVTPPKKYVKVTNDNYFHKKIYPY